MCGIAGILSLSPHSRITVDDLRPMAAAIAHRGPDDEGFHVDAQGRCGLTFRRLSIIDLASGHQPLSNEDGTIWLVFNGEVYNFRQLRADLERRGHRFATLSDSETIVHLYEDLGPACFEKLEGMFAIAIWDSTRGILTLARDRVGKKPLTYAITGDRLYFASEAKSILALPGVPRELDPQALHEYLIFQYVPAPHSIYRGFRKLPPGHLATIHAGRHHPPTPRAFWTVPQPAARNPKQAVTPKEQTDLLARLDTLLTRAVEKRLISDVPLGAFLSGGIDSSIVVGLMRKLGVSPLRTFSIGFAEAKYDESQFARLVAQRFQTEHHEQIVTPKAGEILDILAYHYDEPFADSSAIPTYLVSKFTRESVTVALTGDGGDECFGGYDRYRALGLTRQIDRVPRGLRSMMSGLAGVFPHGQPKSLSHRAHRFLSSLPFSPARRYMSWIEVFPPAMLAAGYTDDFARRLHPQAPIEWFEKLLSGPGSLEARANHADFASYLPYDLLTKVDIASMACSLECRCPLLDHELIEFAVSLPDELRFRAGGKHILKTWARDLLPPEILSRPKMGFGVPVGLWFRSELKADLEDALFASDSLCTRIFRATWLRDLFDSHAAGRRNHEHRLWALFMLECWHRAWSPRL